MDNFIKHADRFKLMYYEVQEIVKSIINIRNRLLNTMKNYEEVHEQMSFYNNIEKSDYVELGKLANHMKTSREFHPTYLWRTKKRSKNSDKIYEFDELTEF